MEVRPPLFLLDLVRGLLSMAPIYLMAQSLDASAFQQVGFTWFILAASVFLLSNTLFLSWPGARAPRSLPGEPDPMTANIDALRVFWLLLNSACMVVLFGLYSVFRSAGEVCPARGETGLQPAFVATPGRIQADFRGAPPIAPAPPWGYLAGLPIPRSASPQAPWRSSTFSRCRA